MGVSSGAQKRGVLLARSLHVEINTKYLKVEYGGRVGLPDIFAAESAFPASAFIRHSLFYSMPLGDSFRIADNTEVIRLG